MKNKEKINFDHSEDSLLKAMGMSPEEAEKFQGPFQETLRKANMCRMSEIAELLHETLPYGMILVLATKQIEKKLFSHG